PDVEGMVQGLPGPRRRGTAVWAAGCVGGGPLANVHRADELALAGEFLLTDCAALTAELGLPSDARPSDAELILAAYRRWGEQLAQRLEGDFSFALWDSRRRRLLCARDALGVKPFYYHLAARTMAFGSDGAAVLCLPEVPRRLDDAALASYLMASFRDRVATGYLDVSRLAPGEVLLVDADRATSRPYWSAGAVGEVRRGADAAYEEAFRDAITKAVAARIGLGPVGVSLSGGLDSSALACVAGRLGPPSLHAYSAVFDEASESDERAWVAAAVAQCGAVARPCRAAGTSPLADWAGASWKGAMPACNPQISVCRVTLEAAALDAVPVVLHGFGGDSCVSHGLAYLAELVGSGRVVRAGAEIEALHRRHGIARRRVLRSYAISPFVPARARRAWRARSRPAGGPPQLLRPAATDRLGLADREEALGARSARRDHAADVGAGIHAHVLEASDRVDAVVGVQRRYPFFDRRLVELCLSMPGDQKLRDGWTRSIMRRALTGVLPEEIRQRAGKGNLGPPFIHALQTTDRAAIEAVVARPGALAEWVDPAALAELWRRCLAGGGDRDWFAIWRVAVASRWLIHHGFDEVPRS
ncbi:MAG: hypothetical protein QOG42_1556, partial [Solirubrobacteraceae bacterium]|nr:hypothetical protein [Solirubrobacteraceae bacterium]